MKGILLAGGSGTRLAPLTNVMSKQLLPVYDKPMICYPLATLMNLNIRDILIISTPNDTPRIQDFLKDGSQFGLNLSYKVQEQPKGIAQSLIIAEEFIGDDNVCLILGDNIFYGAEFSGNHDLLDEKIAQLESGKTGGIIFTYHVSDPERYGVANLNSDGTKITEIEEKPKNPKSHLAVTGIYIYDKNAAQIAKNLQPSPRGELEITDVNKKYLEAGKLDFIKLKRGFAWLDAGTPDSLLDSGTFIQTIEKRQGLKIACIEEIAYKKGFINKQQFEVVKNLYSKSSFYYQYLSSIENDKE